MFNRFLSLILIALSLCSAVFAQPSSRFDEVPLNGLASFVQLRQEYYIGGLYLESLSQDSGDVFNFAGRKRMEMRITIDKWPPRRFGQQWDQAILINNEQEVLNQFADQILAFTDIPKDDLVAGDRITIDMDPNVGTTVYVNNQRMFRVRDNAFFDVLLNTWIGQRPPSSDFKNDILTLPTGQAGTELLTRYEAIIPDPAREKKVAGWSSSPGEDDAGTAIAKNDSPAAPPPGSGTTVTAKRKLEVPAAREAAVAVTSTAAFDAPELEKPKLSAGAPATQPKIAEAAPAPPAPKPEPKPEPVPEPKPKPVAKPEPKPEPKPVAKAEPAKPAVDPEAEAQEKLMRAYRSNILKLTFLNTQYPKRAMDFKQEGLVVLKVTIARSGKVKDVVEETSSEHALLNKAARQAVKKTEPYPEFPKNLNGDTVEITLPFNFRL